MALERQTIKNVTVDPDYHIAFKHLCEIDDIEMNAAIEKLIVREIDERVGKSRLIHKATEGLRVAGNEPESRGIARSRRE